MLLLLLACSSPETERPFLGQGVAGALRVDGDTLRAPGGEPLLQRLVEAPVELGELACAAADGDQAQGELRCYRGATLTLSLSGGRPDRLALSPDGLWLAYFASPRGLPALHLVPTDGSAPAKIMTNGHLSSGQGRPQGFVPPPARGSLRFDGDFVRWDSPEGPVEVRWR